MSYINEQSPAGFEVERPYLPFPVAVAEGVINLDEATGVPLMDALNLLDSGHMPDSKIGLVEVAGGLGAIDLVRVVYHTPSELVLQPSDKGHVDGSSGQIAGMGELVMMLPGGLIRPIGQALPVSRAQWLRPNVTGRPQCTAHRRAQDLGPFAFKPELGAVYHQRRVGNDGIVIARSR